MHRTKPANTQRNLEALTHHQTMMIICLMNVIVSELPKQSRPLFIN